MQRDGRKTGFGSEMRHPSICERAREAFVPSDCRDNGCVKGDAFRSVKRVRWPSARSPVPASRYLKLWPMSSLRSFFLGSRHDTGRCGAMRTLCLGLQRNTFVYRCPVCEMKGNQASGGLDDQPEDSYSMCRGNRWHQRLIARPTSFGTGFLIEGNHLQDAARHPGCGL